MSNMPVIRPGVDVTNEIKLVREMLRSTLWSVDYHEEALTNAHKKLAFGRAMLERLEVTVDEKTALVRYDSAQAEDAESDFEDGQDFAVYVYGELVHSVQWHEVELKRAHEQLAAIKKYWRVEIIPSSQSTRSMPK